MILLDITKPLPQKLKHFEFFGNLFLVAPHTKYVTDRSQTQAKPNDHMLWFELSKQLRQTWKSSDISVNFQLVPWFMHVYSCEVLTLFYESLLKKILALGFYQIFFQGKKPEPLINSANLSESVKNIRILQSKGESICVYFFLLFFNREISKAKTLFVSHVSVWDINMESGLFLCRFWFPFPIIPTFICGREQVKEQS